MEPKYPIMTYFGTRAYGPYTILGCYQDIMYGPDLLVHLTLNPKALRVQVPNYKVYPQKP